MFSNRRWFIILQGFIVVCMMLAPQPILGALPVSNDTPQVEKPPPEESLPSALAPVVSEAEAGPAHTIYLQSRQFIPTAPELNALRQAASATTQTRMHVLVQFDFIPRQMAKAEFEASGVNLLAYIPDYAWIASVATNDPTAVLNLPGATWAGPLTVNDKLDPMIRSGNWGSWNLAPDGTAAVSVIMHQDEQIETGRALVKKHGGQIVGEVIGIRMLMVEMPKGNIRDLAAEDAIQWIEAAEPPLREANDGIRPQIGVNTVQAAPYNLSGTGVDILIYDGGIVTATHADFSGRITVPDVASVSDHATHVAGTAAGSGSLSATNGGTALQWRGMAPGADIISYGYEWNGVGMLFYNNPGDIESDWAAAQNTYGADVGNASLSSNIYANYPLSCTLMGNYGVTSVLMDQIIRGGNAVVGVGDKYIATWAQGNERPSTCSATGYGTTSPPSSAKNPIHVGASNTNDSSMTTFSSWGPTDDGRIKPIVVAGGEQIGGDNGIMSTIPNMFTNTSSRNCNGSGDDYCYPYDTMQGTSMASPAVAGSIALMLQQYRTTYATTGNFWPSTAKAILMQTADDRGNPGPDYQWGFGQVRIQQAVDLIIARGFTQDNVAQGETDLYTFVVTDTATPAQVSLAWDDYEATFNAATALVNNLNLELVAPSGTVWRSWILDPANPANNATRGVNNRDNQEQVTVPTPETGTWLVRVTGTTVPQGPQDYSLACEGCRVVNAGVCQVTVDTPPLVVAPTIIGESGDLALQALPAEPISAGEQWQRDWEQGRSTAVQPPITVTSQEVQSYTPIEPSPLDELDRAKADRLNAALREFDVARNAGPEAVIAFAERSIAEVRELINSEVVEAKAQLATRDNPIALSSPAAPNAARVGINGACAYNTVQEAINAASNGDTIRVVGDFFAESIDISGKNLIIEGGYDAACTALVPGATSRLDAVTNGSVVDLTGSSVVTLRNLTLGWGSSFGAGLDLLSSSHATLDNTDIVHNNGSFGGGIYIGSGSQVTLTNGSMLQYNTGSAGAGAIVYGRLNALDTYSDLADNCSTSDGGGAYVYNGTLYFSEADLTGNQAAGTTGRGGAIFATAGSVITLTGGAYIGDAGSYANTAYDGGGVYADNSTLNLNSAATTLSNNAADHYGGGVYLTNNAQLVVNGGRIGSDFNSSTGNDAILGAGIYAITSTVSGSVRLYNNIAATSGGGLYADASTITLTDSTIGDVGPNRQNQIGATGLNGGGLYLINNTHTTLTNTVVASNTLFNSSIGYGGGAYVRAGSFLTATNSRIERHALPSVFDGKGAGLYIYDATVTLSNTQVQTNTTPNLGAGARLFGTSTLNVLGGSAFVDNRATGGVGGAIAAASTPDINVDNATFQNNYASTHGGAIYLDAGTLYATGWWDFRFNGAGGNGGAVALYGTGNADFRAGGDRASYLAVNVAGGDGGALYVGNTDTVQLYATNGQIFNLNTNQAGSDGGAVYADAGAFFDVYGDIQSSSNIAVGNGGVFYLGGGSRIWLDDYVNARPQILVNQAANGGAIYASNSPRVECDGADFGYIPIGNRATSGSGGAIYLSGSTLMADNCVFRGNRAMAGDGGAIAAYTSTVRIDADYPFALNTPIDQQGPMGVPDRLEPSVPQATSCDPLATQCSQFTSNRAISSTASNGNGGAIYVNASTLSVNDTYLQRNTAVRGGAIYQENAAARGWLSNTLVYSNTSLAPLGAGIRNASGAMTLTHVTAANNTGGAGFSPSGAQNYVYNTIIWGNSVAAFGSLTAAMCNIDQGGTAGPAVNPEFMAAGAGEDYHLASNSPAIDACATGITHDLDNTPRPFMTAYDMGVYEYLNGLTFTPDRTGAGYTGQSVLYTHTLTNTSVTTATFAFAGLSAHGWALTLPPSVTLGTGQSVSVEVSVHIPPDAPVGTVDTAVITATLDADPTLSGQVNDTTTVLCQPITGADFTFIPSPAGTNKPVVFTGTVTTGQLPITYTWNFGDGSSEDTGNPIMHTFTTSNTFTVWMTATNACPSIGTAMRQVTAVVTDVYIYLPLVMRNY